MIRLINGKRATMCNSLMGSTFSRPYLRRTVRYWETVYRFDGVSRRS